MSGEKYLQLFDAPPLNAAAGEYNLQWAVKTFEAASLAALEVQINNWLLTDPVTTGVPRWLGNIDYAIAASGNDRYTALVPFAYWVAPVLL